MHAGRNQRTGESTAVMNTDLRRLPRK